MVAKTKIKESVRVPLADARALHALDEELGHVQRRLTELVQSRDRLLRVRATMAERLGLDGLTPYVWRVLEDDGESDVALAMPVSTEDVARLREEAQQLAPMEAS